MSKDASQFLLRELFQYNHETGEFSRIVSRNGRFGCIGPVTKSFDRHGYQVIGISGRRQFAHRMAWIYMHGQIPEEAIDHINGNRSDNRIKNLRPASKAANNRNISVISRRNKTGYSCVFKVKKSYRFCCVINGKKFSQGKFATPELAYSQLLKIRMAHADMRIR